MEDLMVHHDGTVRGNNNIIVQFIYNNTGLNQSLHKPAKIEFINYNNEKLIKEFLFNDE
jgi:hypothetical protein